MDKKYNDFKIHQAKKGDTASSICFEYGIPENDLVQANPQIPIVSYGGSLLSKSRYVWDVKQGDSVKIPFFNEGKAKKGVKTIKGKNAVKAGVWETYEVSEWYEGTPPDQRNENFVKWDLYYLQNGKKPERVLQKDIGHFRFKQGAVGNKYRVVGYVHEPELNNASGIIVGVESAEKREIQSIKLSDSSKAPIKGPLSYGKDLNVHVYTTGMIGEKVYICLWEDDAKGAGHSQENKYNLVAEKTRTVGEKGVAHHCFVLSPDFKKIANAHFAKGDKNEGSTHEYYVTAYASRETKASDNVNIHNSDYKVGRKTETEDHLAKSKPKPKTSDFEGKVLSRITPPKIGQNTTLGQTAPKKAPQPKGEIGIKAIYFADKDWKKNQNSSYGSAIKVFIESKGLKGKKVKLWLYEQDKTDPNDVLFEKEIIITNDLCYETIELTSGMQKEGTRNEIGEGSSQEIFARAKIIDVPSHIVSIGLKADITTVKIDVAESVSVVKVGKVEIKKEKFAPVKEKAEEAVIYISSEIATPIKLDAKGNLESYPDYGAYNGQDEYKENGNIYCKKFKVGKNFKSAFPTYKVYIYRGNSKGEAVKKLKQDLKFKTHENAEATVLEVARHSGSNNKNYGNEGPVPPSSIDKLHGLRYRIGTNKGKTSYRYRIVDSNSSNFPVIKDYKKEYDSGSMNLGTRSSISIDPWKSKDLIGCIGIRDTGGGNHPSSKSYISKQDATNYKYIYHSINNYLEGIIPELTGIYGRRGFSKAEGTLAVADSSYDHEVKVYVLVDKLPEINDCDCKDLRGPKERKVFYDSFGTKTINYIDKKSTANKFKGLYMVAQRRQENGFSLKTIGNNPMNIKGNGDAGQIGIDTHETINGKYVSVPGEKFANFSSEDKGFQGYLDLLDSNYNDAYKSLFDDSKTIDDFTSGLEDTGKKGAYATGKAQGGLSGTDDYKAKVKQLFNGVKKDYLIIYECMLCKEKDADKKKKIQEDIELLKKLK